MTKMQRNKGKRGEREFLNKLGELLNQDLSRNLNQSANGGADCVDVNGFAIEIKRRESLSLGQWWKQATNQARTLNRQPALAYRQSRKPWRIVVPLAAISPDLPADMQAELSIQGFAVLVQRVSLEREEAA